MNNAAPAFVFFFIFAVIALFVGLLAAAQQQKRQRLLEQIARRFHGRAEAGSWFAPPQVRLRFQNQPAILKIAKVGKHSHHTNFLINWPDRGLRCEIYPEDILGGFRKLLGVEDIEIGSPQFDAAFIINANSRAAARELLTPDVQGAIFRLAALEPGGFSSGLRRGVQVKWGGGLLTVTKPCELLTYGSLEQFISLCGQLYAAAVASKTSGIEFIGEVQEPDAVESQCQVCGEPLAQDLVYCASCHTPHHRECWEYFGGCSTYACGQKRYVQRTPKRRKAS